MMNVPPRRFSPEYIVAGTAALISFMTLCVYIYQAKLAREQQRTSVWPYLEWLETDEGDFHIDVKNKGIGPAIIKKVEMTIDGKPLADNAAIVTAVVGDASKLQWSNTDINGQVLSPGEVLTPLRIKDETYKSFASRFYQHRFEMHIFYSSVYGDCWMCSGVKVKPISPLE